jgi:hypothetical protein
MTPQGVSKTGNGRRRKKPSTEAVEVSPAIGQAEANEVMRFVSTTAGTIKLAHTRIASTLMEIGEMFYQIKHRIESISAEVRRANKVPSFTKWMNNVAPELCNMSDRTAWHYYQEYTGAIAAKLTPETIQALAPTVLRNEKPRQAVLAAVKRNPELAEQLNQAARKPAQLKKIAQSEPVQSILKKLETAPRTRSQRIEDAIVSAYKDVFDPKKFDINQANAAITELSTVLRNAATKLNISSHISVSITPWTAREPRIELTPGIVEQPRNVEELVAALNKAGYKLPTLAATA